MRPIKEPEADGLRRYGQWGGYPQGNKEDVTRCVESVIHSYVSAQCQRKRGKGFGGLFCGTHAKDHPA